MGPARMCPDRTRRAEDVIEVWRLPDAAPVCRRRRMKLAVKACTYDLVGVLEDLEAGWTLRSVSVCPLVPPADLAGNRGLVSADLRMWETRSDFHANCCRKRRLQPVDGRASY
jgi:hypothetical protein